MKLVKKQIMADLRKVGGEWGIVLHDVKRNQVWKWNECEPFYAASIIKIPIIGAVLDLQKRGSICLRDPLELTREDIVGGFGVLKQMTPGMKLPIQDLMTLMIIQSDNTATNMLLDYTGIKAVRDVIHPKYMPNTKIYHKMMREEKTTPSNVITAGDIHQLLLHVVRGEFIHPEISEQMIHLLKQQQVSYGLPAYLPEKKRGKRDNNDSWVIAHKTGTGDDLHHDVGIMYVGSEVMIVTVLSRGCNFQQATSTIRNIGKSVYEYMK